MKATELIKKLEAEIQEHGDHEVVFAANRHSYTNAVLVTRSDTTTLSLFDKIPD